MGKRGIFVGVCGACFLLLLATQPFFANAAEPPDHWPKHVTFSSGRTGSAIFTVVSGITTLMNKYMGVKAVPEGASMGRNVVLAHDKDVEMSITLGYAGFTGARGIGKYKQYGPMNIRLMWKGDVPPVTYITKRTAEHMRCRPKYDYTLIHFAHLPRAGNHSAPVYNGAQSLKVDIFIDEKFTGQFGGAVKSPRPFQRECFTYALLRDARYLLRSGN